MKHTLIITLLFLLFAGCEDGNTGFIITGVLLPTEGECTYAANNPVLLEGVLDLQSNAAIDRARGSASPSYTAVLRFENGTVTRGNTGYPAMADQAGVYVESVEVELSKANGDLVAEPYSVTLPQTFIPSTTGTQRELGYGLAQIIPPSVGQMLASRSDLGSIILVSIKAFARTIGGTTFSTRPMVHQIRLCRGCLFQCRRLLPMEVGADETSCLPGQDIPTVDAFADGETCAFQ